MGIELKQTTRLQLDLKLTLQMQMTLRVLQLSKLELNQMITTELEQNPILEGKEPASGDPLINDFSGDLDTDQNDNILYDNFQKDFSEAPYSRAGSREYEKFDNSNIQRETNYSNYLNSRSEGTSFVGQPETLSDDRNLKLSTYYVQKGLIEHLMEQLVFADLSEKDKEIGEHIIRNLNDDGYLKNEERDGGDLVRLIAIYSRATEEDVLRVLKVIQDFDPPGVAARDLKECLIIQARHCNIGNEIIIKAIEDHLSNFERKRYAVIAKALNISEEDVYNIERIIKGFNPRPGSSFSNIQADYVMPDVEIYRDGDKFKARLIKNDLPSLFIKKDYLKIMRRRGRDPNSRFIRNSYNKAKILLEAINQRERRLIQVAEMIIERQQDFFLKGEGFLRPLQEKDVAEALNLNVSTVSRIFNAKYILTPHGVFPMKYFIKRPVVSNDGEDISNDLIKTMIRRMIEEEDPHFPLKDNEIARRLDRQNIRIKRRTVAKYREEMGIKSYIIRKRANKLPKREA